MEYKVEFKDVATRSETRQHIGVKPDPCPHPPAHSTVQVPEGGAGWAFILAAVAAITWAATTRFFEKNANQAA